MNNHIRTYDSSKRAIDNGLQQYMVKVYSHMTFGLLITALSAAAVLAFEPLTRLLFTFDLLGNLTGHTGFGYLVAFAPFCIALYLNGKFTNMTFSRSRSLLGIYAALTGVSFASLAFSYTIFSLQKTFLITAVTFGVMSIYGYTTKRDLNGVGSFCMMGIWALIISGLVNIFFKSEAIHFVTSFIGVIVFISFVAYNTQSLKTLYYTVQNTSLAEKAALMGAFCLYLNFLNLFLYLLRFLGERKKRN